MNGGEDVTVTTNPKGGGKAMGMKVELATQREGWDPKGQIVGPKTSLQHSLVCICERGILSVCAHLCRGNGDSGFYQKQKNIKIEVTSSTAGACTKPKNTTIAKHTQLWRREVVIWSHRPIPPDVFGHSVTINNEVM